MVSRSVAAYGRKPSRSRIIIRCCFITLPSHLYCWYICGGRANCLAKCSMTSLGTSEGSSGKRASCWKNFRRTTNPSRLWLTIPLRCASSSELRMKLSINCSSVHRCFTFFSYGETKKSADKREFRHLSILNSMNLRHFQWGMAWKRAKYQVQKRKRHFFGLHDAAIVRYNKVGIEDGSTYVWQFLQNPALGCSYVAFTPSQNIASLTGYQYIVDAVNAL